MEHKTDAKANYKSSKDSTLTKKICLLHKFSPFIFLKLDYESARYRISTNYEFLNKNFNLKINYIRDLEKVDRLDNSIFEIKDNKIIPDQEYFKSFRIDVSSTNYCTVHKYLDKTEENVSSILIFERVYIEKDEKDTNYSILFVSDEFFSFNSYLKGN